MMYQHVFAGSFLETMVGCCVGVGWMLPMTTVHVVVTPLSVRQSVSRTDGVADFQLVVGMC